MMTEVEVYCGYKIVDENNVVNDFIVGSTCNGHCYKDYEAFNKGEGVCYISEYEYEDMREQLSSLCLDYDNDRITEEEYNEERQHILTNVGWTRRDLLELVGFDNAYDEQMQLGLVKLASIILEGVDWQSPETYFNEFEIDDYILSYCGLTEKQINIAFGWNYFETENNSINHINKAMNLYEKYDLYKKQQNNEKIISLAEEMAQFLKEYVAETK